MAQYKRILLKLSGESLMGGKQYGIDEVRLNEYAAQIKEIAEMGVQIGIVIGGGNIFRGLSGASKGFDRVKGDQMGMLATVINSLALSSALVAAPKILLIWCSSQRPSMRRHWCGQSMDFFWKKNKSLR